MLELKLKRKSEISQSQWLGYWKGYYDSGEMQEYYEMIREASWAHELKVLKAREELGECSHYGLRSIAYVLLKDDKIIGNGSIFLNIEVVPDEEGPNHIGLGISPLYRGQGYGTHMFHLMVKECSKLGFSELIIVCDDKNTESARMIEKNSGKLKDKFICNGSNPVRAGRLHRMYTIDVDESLKKYQQKVGK